MIKKNVPIYFFLIFSLSCSFIYSGCQIMPPAPNEAKWTVMVYLAADNNLEPMGIQDFNEMEMVGSTEDVNIVLQIDRIPYNILNQYKPGYGIYDDDSNSNWTSTRRYYVTQDMNPEIINSTLKMELGEKNMGDPETLKDFAQWAIQNYPAQHYMLVLWNHGGGFRSFETTRDICEDYTNDDIITMPQLEEALAFIYNQLGREIDIVGMDACFMAMVEVAYQVKDYTQIMVASEASIPGDGWQYDCLLQNLVTYPDQNAEQFAADIVNCYYDQYSGSWNNVTLSAIDLIKIENLVEKISILAQAIMGDSYSIKSSYRNARDTSQYYTGLGFEYIDLKDYVNKLSDFTSNSKVLSAANQVNQMLESENIVIENIYYGNYVNSSHGLSIYFPYYSYDSYYDYTNFSQDTLWDEMLEYLGY